MFKVLGYYILQESEWKADPTYYNKWSGKNPMCHTFPRVATCNYWRYGSGGYQENLNAICILGLNQINDKIFMVLWWWCLIISCIGILRLIWRSSMCVSSYVRFQLMNMRMNRYFGRYKDMKNIKVFIRNCSLGDWFVLYQMSKNLNKPFFMEFLCCLCEKYCIKCDRESKLEVPKDDDGDE